MFYRIREFFALIGELLSLAKVTSRQVELEAQLRPRQIQNLTSTYTGLIKRDFPEFDAQEFLSTAENTLLRIFNALETQTMSDEASFSPNIKKQLAEVIEDIRSKNENWHFDDVTVHNSAISSYKKVSGSREITIELAVSYIYRIEAGSANSSETEAEAKLGQYKYVMTAVYIQNAALMGNGSMQGHNCPNCGAPVLSMGDDKFCAYCGTGLREVNTRIWAFDHYKRV